MSNKVLAFYVDAPLQSWGVSSQFDRRNTELHPTKSGVVGILAAALGIDFDSLTEEAEIAELAGLRMTTYGIDKNAGYSAARLTDYHTIGGGWQETHKKDPANLFAKLSVPRSANSPAPWGVVQTWRCYLVDAKFVVFLEGNSEVLEKCRASLENPKYGVWFGRKSCIPSTHLSPVIAGSICDALVALSRRIDCPNLPSMVTSRLEERYGDGAWFQRDQPISFKNRKYAARPVCRILD